MINRILKLATLIFLVALLSACSAIPAGLSELSQLITTQAPSVTMEIKPVTYNQEPTLAAQATEAPQAQAPVTQTVQQTQSYAQDLEAALVNLYQVANPAVVYIITGQGSGSGFVYDGSGHIVTNNHVVEGNRRVEVVFAGGERLMADLDRATGVFHTMVAERDLPERERIGTPWMTGKRRFTRSTTRRGTS